MKFTVMRAHLLLLFQLDRPQANDRFYRVVFFHPGLESAQFFMAHHLIAEVVYFQKAQAMYWMTLGFYAAKVTMFDSFFCDGSLVFR